MYINNTKKYKRKIINKKQLSVFLKKINIEKIDKNIYLLWFFLILFLIITFRLFILQIIRWQHYNKILWQKYISKSLLKAKRWDIYIYDKSNKKVKLTENIKLYNIFVEPPYIRDKNKFIDLITPIVYEHLCIYHWMIKITNKENCIKNIEYFSNKKLLPQKPNFFYYWSWRISKWYDNFDLTWFLKQKDIVIKNFSTWTANKIIKNTLNKMIYIWIKPRNYLGFFENYDFLNEIKKLNFIDILWDNYVYIVPQKVNNFKNNLKQIKFILNKYWYLKDYENNLENKFFEQKNKYVKIISNVNPQIIKKVNKLKEDTYKIQNNSLIPILHWLWTEEIRKRYYIYNSFLANILWYVNKEWKSFYWIEQYFNNILAGKDWEIRWKSSAILWQIWINEFEITKPIDWKDIFLTIDIWIQRELEFIAKKYKSYLKADSVSILVYDPFSWQVKADVNYPTFNPNNYNDTYSFKPLTIENKKILDDKTFIDIPVYYKTWWIMKIASTKIRYNTWIQKYINKNVYWPQVFIDKNIAESYEPWSIFKAFTVWIWYDIDEIRFYDFYNDPWFVKIWPYTIKNADKHCMWDNTFLHALIYSCNVWMIRIAQKIQKEVFYNYLNKMWFWHLTHIELANEDPWEVRSMATVSKARFFNNTFWQWLKATPLQIAVWYWTLLNWWFYIKPTIIEWIYDKQNKKYIKNKTKIIRQVIKKDTSNAVKQALYTIVETNEIYQKNIKIEWFKLWWKSWTSQISYKWKYKKWLWRTNWSFVWIVTIDNLKYIVVVQVRRPRTKVRWWETAWKVFNRVANFLIWYSNIQK